MNAPRLVLASAVATACALGVVGTAAAAPAPSAAPAASVTSVTSVTSTRPVLRVGSRGESVRVVQRTLRLLDERIAVDGAYGPATAAAVRRYQKSIGLPVTGVVASLTWHELGADDPARIVGSPTMRTGHHGEGVRRLQRQLNAQNDINRRMTGPHVAVDGAFGPATRAAVVSLQKASGLRATGVADQATWTAVWDGFGE